MMVVSQRAASRMAAVLRVMRHATLACTLLALCSVTTIFSLLSLHHHAAAAPTSSTSHHAPAPAALHHHARVISALLISHHPAMTRVARMPRDFRASALDGS